MRRDFYPPSGKSVIGMMEVYGLGENGSPQDRRDAAMVLRNIAIACGELVGHLEDSETPAEGND